MKYFKLLKVSRKMLRMKYLYYCYWTYITLMRFLTLKYRHFDIKLNMVLDHFFLSTELNVILEYFFLIISSLDKECSTALNCQFKIPQGHTTIFMWKKARFGFLYLWVLFCSPDLELVWVYSWDLNYASEDS